MPFILGLLSGIYFITFNTIGANLLFMPGDLGDTRFNLYLLEHAHRFFTAQVNDYWSAPFMFPEKNVITLSDNLLGTAPFYSFFRLLGCDTDSAFQLWFMALIVLNYSACYYFLNYLFKNTYAAALGAFIFAFSLALQSQVGHAQTYPRFAVPLALWAGLNYFKELNPRYFFIFLFLYVYQVYCGIYLGLLLLVPFAALFLYSVYDKWQLYKIKVRNKEWLMKMAIATLCNLALLYLLMAPYMQRAKEMGLYSYDFICGSIPTVKSFLFSCHGSYLWESLREFAISYPAFWDHQIFAGAAANVCLLIFVLFVLVAIYKRRAGYFNVDKNSIALCLITLVTFVFFIRFRNYSLYWLLYHLPGFASMRALQRIINIELVFYAVAAAFVFKAVLNPQKIISLFLFIVFLAFLVTDNYVLEDIQHKTDKAVFKNHVTILQQKMKDIPKNKVVSYEPDSVPVKSYIVHLDAMLAAQSLGLKTMNGYSATSPGGFGDYWLKPNETNRKTWLERKGCEKVDLVVVK